MIAKRLEGMLSSAMGDNQSNDMVRRFQELRQVALLPTSRGQHADSLTPEQAAAGLMSVVSQRPSHAGLTAKVLLGLLPVGGKTHSFRMAETFSDALSLILADPDVAASVIEVRASDSAFATNDPGRTAIEYDDCGTVRIAYFVHRTAVSLFQPQAWQTFNPKEGIGEIATWRIFPASFLSRIARHLREDRKREDVMARLLRAAEDRS